MKEVDAPIYAEIAIRIRGMRVAAGLKQDDLAIAASVTRSSIANLEAGRQSLPLGKLSLIATRLGTTLSMLMPGAPLEGRALELKQKYDAVAEAKRNLALALADLDDLRNDIEEPTP